MWSDGVVVAPPGLNQHLCLGEAVEAAPAPGGAQKFPLAASCRMSVSSVRSKIARRIRKSPLWKGMACALIVPATPLLRC